MAIPGMPAISSGGFRLKQFSTFLVLVLLALPTGAGGFTPGLVLHGPARDHPASGSPSESRSEAYNTGWTFYLDNDAFSTLDIDQDYTGGFAVSLSGRRARTYPLSIDFLLQALNRLSCARRLYQDHEGFQLHSIEFGLTSFTPENIAASEPIYDDHPYASLIFLANLQQLVVPKKRISCQTGLTVGILGTDLAEIIQTEIHEILDQQVPEGWDNQISEGGEPTARYTVLFQWSASGGYEEGFLSHEIKTSVEGNLGYTTDVGLGISARLGKIHSPWWSFNPHQAEYMSLGSPVTGQRTGEHPREIYIWMGINARYRFYNAILQGQFRESPVTFSRDDLNPVIGDAWAGLTVEAYRGLRVSAFVRARTKELKVAKRDQLWGGVILSFARPTFGK
jgi:hypothetical protein